MGTWKKVRKTEIGKSKPLPLMWVFTYKFDVDGYLLKYKARLVVRGDLYVQKEKDTYAATLATRVFRALMAIAAYFDLDIWQFDAINAFGNAYLDETVYTHCAEGFEEEEGIKNDELWLLIRALYGLPRSPLLWFKTLSTELGKLGLKPVPESSCLFTNEYLVVFFYVDDIVVLCHPSNRNKYEEFKLLLLKTFKMREMGEIRWFLGIRVVRDRLQRKIWLCQDSYIQKTADTYSIKLLAKPPKTPLETTKLMPYNGKATAHEIHEYQRKIGSLTYPANACRPDIAHASQQLAQYLQNPSPEHMRAAERVLEYLLSTKYLALQCGGIEDYDVSPVFEGASDAAFADNNDRKSTEGKFFKLLNTVIDYQAIKQGTVTTSTTEAELLALSHLIAWLLWWIRFFDNIMLDLEEDPIIYCDNLQTIRLMLKESPKLVTKLKHVDIHQHWVRQEVEKGTFKLEWIETGKMPADGFTKALPAQNHANFIKYLNMVDIRQLVEGQ